MSPVLRGSANDTRRGQTSAPPDTISVLIVDDDELVAEVLAACCDEPDMKVVGIVHNSDDALMAAGSMAPQVALVDHRLAGTNGVELARGLLDVCPGVKIVIITADPSPEVERAARAAGCVACVGKTMNIGGALPDLVRRVHRDGPSTAPILPHPQG